MKLFVASDIHGDAFRCQKMIEKYKESGAQKMVLLGDILYHGPRNPVPEHYDPKKTAAMLNEISSQILCVRGNCDAEVDQMMLNFPVMSEYSQILTENRTIFLTHGHHHNMDDLPPLSKGDVFLQGHTHLPVLEERDGIILANPGSVSLPKGGNPHTYMIIDDNGMTIISFDGKEMAKLESV